MPFVPVPETLAVEVIFGQDLQRVENTLYFRKDRGWDVTDVETFIQQLRDLVETELLPLLTNTITLIELVGRVLDTATAIGFSIPGTAGNSGGQSGQPKSNNTTYTISFKTGLTGRSFRGRNYVVGIPENGANGNTINTSFRTGVLAFYASVKALASENGTPWVVVSRYSGVDPITHKPIPRVTGITTPITSVTTFDMTVDSQRRRLPGRGA